MNVKNTNTAYLVPNTLKLDVIKPESWKAKNFEQVNGLIGWQLIVIKGFFAFKLERENVIYVREFKCEFHRGKLRIHPETLNDFEYIDFNGFAKVVQDEMNRCGMMEEFAAICDELENKYIDFSGKNGGAL
jgi:hypothetical protein